MALKAITVNTPATDRAHIFAEDDAAIYQSIIGNDGVFNIGEKFKTTVISNNKVRVGNGVLNVQGHVARTVYGDYTDMTIENGVSGKKRNDLIVAKFTVGSDSDIFTLEVKKGVAGTTATDPIVTKGDLYNGSKVRELPLWRVKIENLSIVKVEQMFTVVATNKELLDEINGLSSSVGYDCIKSINGTVKKYKDGRFEASGNFKISTALDFVQIGTTNIYYAPYVNGNIGIRAVSVESVVCEAHNTGVVWHGKPQVNGEALSGMILQYGNGKRDTYVNYIVRGKWK